MIDQLQAVISQGTQIPFTNQRLVRAQDVEQLLERMRISVPGSIRDSERMLAERDRIMAEARAEADRIVQQARQQAMEMLSEKSLVTTAQVEADRIIAEGKEIARKRAEEADVYAVQVLQELAAQLQGILQQVGNGIELMRGAPQIPENAERPERPERPERRMRPPARN